MRYTRKWVCRCGSVLVYPWRTGGEIYINLEKGVAHATKKWKEGNAKEMPRKGRNTKLKQMPLIKVKLKDSGQRHMGTKATSVLLLR